jgi:hypothetical protein
MSILPDVNVNPIDGALGLASQGNPGLFAAVGFATEGDIDTPAMVVDADEIADAYGSGNLANALKDALSSGAQAIVAVRAKDPVAEVADDPVKVDGDPWVSPIEHTGTGEGSVTQTGTPTGNQFIEVGITGDGDVGVALFSWRLNGGDWSDDILTAADVELPGTGITLHFVDGGAGDSFVNGDTYEFYTVTSSAGEMTVTGTPNEEYAVEVEVFSTGTNGRLDDATFKVTVNGEESEELPVVASYELPGTGLTLNFAEGPDGVGSFVDGDTWTFESAWTISPTSAISDGLAAIGDYDVSFIVVTEPGDSTMFAALTAKVATEFTAKYRYLHLVTVAPGPEEDQTVDEWVAALLAEAADVSDVRLSVVASQVELTDPATGTTVTRSMCGIYAGRLSKTEIQRSVGAPIDGPLPLVTGLSPAGINEAHVGQLDATGHYITARRLVGLSGLYVTNGRMMVDDTSDYRWVEWRRVMDFACREVRLAGLRSMHREATETGLEALVTDLEQPLARMQGAGQIVDYSVRIPAGQDIIATSTVRVKVRIQPVPNMRWIELEVGFENPFRA